MQYGRPLMLGSLDKRIWKFVMILREKRIVVNSVVTIAVTRALMEKSKDEHFEKHGCSFTNLNSKSILEYMNLLKEQTDKPAIFVERWRKLNCFFRTKLLVWLRIIGFHHHSLWTLIRPHWSMLLFQTEEG